MKKYLLTFALLMCASLALGQVPCSECLPADDITCIISPEICEECWDTCYRVRITTPVGPGRQAGVDYMLHRQVGVTAIDYGPNDLEMTEILADEGFRTVQLWTDTVPYCPGHHEPPFPSTEWVVDEPGCEFEQFIRRTRAKQIFVRLHAWADTEGNDQPNACRINTLEPAGHIVYRLYEMFWWKDITIVVTPWEQGWYSLGCWDCPEREECCPETYRNDCTWGLKRQEYMVRQDRLVAQYERLMVHVKQARALMIQRYPKAKLNVTFAMTVNKSGGYNVPGQPPRYEWTEGLPTLAERIGWMDNPPDYVAVSYYVYGVDPTIVLDHIKEATRFPKHRIFIAEFGGNTPESQVQRIADYVPAFWDWGIRTVLLWVYYQPEDTPWMLTDEALDEARRLNIEAISW